MAAFTVARTPLAPFPAPSVSPWRVWPVRVPEMLGPAVEFAGPALREKPGMVSGERAEAVCVWLRAPPGAKHGANVGVKDGPVSGPVVGVWPLRTRFCPDETRLWIDSQVSVRSRICHSGAGGTQTWRERASCAVSATTAAESFRLLSWLDSASPEKGLRVAESNGEWSFTPYSELAGEVRHFANELRATGAAPGSVVTILATEVKSFVTSFMGTLAAGLTPSPVAPPRSYRTMERYSAHLTRIIAVAEPSVVVTQEATHEAAEAICRELDAKARLVAAPPAHGGPTAAAADFARSDRADEELALLQFTSGSSGNPKGVRVSWGALTANVGAIRDWLSVGPEDVFASWLPLFHDMGLVGAMIMPVASGIDLWLMTPEQFIRSPERWLACFGRHGATLTTAPSFGYSYCARRVKPEQLADHDFSAWRVGILGAERIDPQGVADFTALTGPFGFDEHALVAAYGLAESTLAVTGVTPGDGSPMVRLGNGNSEFGTPATVLADGVLGRDRASGNWLVGCGRPVGDLAVRILDEDGNPVPEGHFGQIAVTGSSVADGYLYSDGTRTDFTGGVLATGDGGFLWQGQLYVIGRIADSLKVRGAAVFAEDLETELGTLPGLGSSRLVTLLGSVDAADHVVLLVEAADSAEWLDAAVNTLRAATGPEINVSVLLGRRGAVELTSSGKPRRRVLWHRLLRGDTAGWQPVHGTAPRPLAAETRTGEIA
ncbi:AMP-binding protein [Kitasatospora sp. NPDC097643]|uniref:AMP-binding protein n=1 Tax=Kitasatospora sp. NPDC097643 TaxID=3157230 RepID=UPI0033225492